MKRSVVVLLTTFIVVAGLAPSTRAAQKPNVILVMTDDQGYGDVGAHGNEMIRTPNLDKLYTQSLRLTNYHVDPTCSPTRSALLTGRYSSRTGVWHTIMGRSILHKDEVTLADVFAKAGYRCGMTGKWHLGDCYPYRPLERGFHEALHHGGGGIGQTPDYWGNDYFDDTYWLGGEPKKYDGYCTDVFFDWALDFVSRQKDQPFFCYIATNVPHGPYNVAKKYSDLYREKGVPGNMANFYGMLENFDENMGRLMARLDELKLAENTILIFTTDNGTAAGIAGKGGTVNGKWTGFNDGMRGRKGSEYDGGHRVPFFIRWPGEIKAGKDVPNLTAHIDVLPTLADVCGISLPDGLDIDGKSLVPLFQGRAWKPRTLVVHSQRIEHPKEWRKSAVMTDRWRLVNGKELYDMENDPGQSKNVAEEYGDKVEELRAAYEKWWQHIDERFDDYVRIPLGKSEANPTSFTCHDWHGSQVPWHQGHIRGMMKANGFWAIDVTEPGTYEFTLRLRPAGVEFPLQKGEAVVRVSNKKKLQSTGDLVPIKPGESSARLTLKLPAGPAELHTKINEEKRGERGAYYVTVRRLD